MVAASVVAPRVTRQIAVGERRESADVIGLATPSPAAQLNARGARLDHVKKGAADAAYVPEPIQNQHSKWARFLQLLAGSRPPSSRAGKKHSGRSTTCCDLLSN
jgi:hypothetical protein